jgi:hypothetical protein
MRNGDRIHTEWQQRDVGETVFLHRPHRLPVVLHGCTYHRPIREPKEDGQ